jgi:hypothetical protein
VAADSAFLPAGFSLDAQPPANGGGNRGARARGVRCQVPGVRGKRTAPHVLGVALSWGTDSQRERGTAKSGRATLLGRTLFGPTRTAAQHEEERSSAWGRTLREAGAAP